jgi:ABC-type transporter Mla subunit MlaD
MRSTPNNEIPKIEIDNIAILSENIQDMKTELVKSINTTNQSSQETIKQLNKLMSQVLEVMQEMAEDSGNIERNTRSMGNNIANGRISAVR